MARRLFGGRQPVKNIGAKPPERTTHNEDGVPVVEKLNPMRFKRRMVSPQGGTPEMSLANGYTQAGPKNNPYFAEIWPEKIQKGWIPFDECPVGATYTDAQGFSHPLPGFRPRKDDKRCTGKFSRDECCPHVRRVIEARRAAHEQKQAEYATGFSTNQERMVRLMEQQMAQQLAATSPDKKGIKGA